MKTLFLFRDAYDSKYILHKLESKNLLGAVILERGVEAKKRKLQRIFKITNILSYPILILDTLSLILFSKHINANVKKKLGLYCYPKDRIKLIVDDANEKSCVDFIRQYEPDVIFIYGISILTDRFFKQVKTRILNIHSGIVPMYRNVHSDFWAYLNKDYSNIGLSVMYADKGIDSGDIALQKRINYAKNDGLINIKIKILNLIPDIVAETLNNMRNNKLNRKKQNIKESHFYPTPGLLDIIKYLLV